MKDSEKKDLFETVLDRRTYLQRELLLVLNNLQGQWVSRDWLSKKLCLSKKMTLQTVNELVTKIKKLQPVDFDLCTSKGKGVCLNVKEEGDIYDLIACVVSDSAIVQLFEALAFEEFESVKSYSQRHYMSESTTRRHLKRLREALETFQIEVGREDGRLIGAEQQIRMVLIVYFWGIYQGNQWPFKNVDEARVEQLVEQLLDNDYTNYPYIPYVYRRQLQYIFAEAIIRSRKGHTIVVTPELQKLVIETELFRRFDALLQIGEGTIDVHQGEVALYFLIWLSMSKTVSVFKLDVIEALMTEKKWQDSRIFKTAKLAIDEFQREFFPITVEQSEKLAMYTMAGHFFVNYFKGFNMDIAGNTYRTIYGERYPFLIDKMQQLIRTLYQKTADPIFLEEDFLLISYLRNFQLFGDPCMYEPQITVFVESDMQNLLIKAFIEQLEGYFCKLYHVKWVNIFSINRGDQVDLLLTTSGIKGIKKDYPALNILVIGKSLGINDLNRIDQALKKIAQKKNHQQNHQK